MQNRFEWEHRVLHQFLSPSKLTNLSKKQNNKMTTTTRKTLAWMIFYLPQKEKVFFVLKVVFCFLFLLVSSAVSHGHDNNPYPIMIFFLEVGKKMCRSPPPPTPPPLPLSRLFQGWRNIFWARAAVARHFAPPKQTPWRRPNLTFTCPGQSGKCLYMYM